MNWLRNHGNSRHASGASTNDGFPAGGAVSVGPADVWKEFEVFQRGAVGGPSGMTTERSLMAGA